MTCNRPRCEPLIPRRHVVCCVPRKGMCLSTNCRMHPGGARKIPSQKAFWRFVAGGMAPARFTPQLYEQIKAVYPGHTCTVHILPCASNIMDAETLADPGGGIILSQDRAFLGIVAGGHGTSSVHTAAIWIKSKRHTRGIHTRCAYRPARRI